MQPETIDTIEKNIGSAMGRYGLAGLGVGIVHKGTLVYAKGFGFANLARREPVTPETVFRIASISKIVSAVGLMQLWEQGRLQLDDPANAHLTSFKIQPRRGPGQAVTLRHLLTHTAGFGETAPLISYLHPKTFFGMGRAGRPPLPLRRFYGRWLKPNAPPGVKWYYANHGLAVIGQIIADVSGYSGRAGPDAESTAFADYMRDHVFEPLGMEKSDFLRRPRVLAGLASGYVKENRWLRLIPGNWRAWHGQLDTAGTRLQAAWPDVEIITQADGSLYTTVNDFAKFIGALLDAKILKRETLEEMWRPHFQLDPRLPGMGLGFFWDDWDGRRIISHDGAWIGFTTSLWLAPEQDTGVFAFTNTGHTGVTNLAANILRTLTGIPNPRANLPDLPDEPERWPELVGHYHPPPGFNSNLRLWLSYGGRLSVYTEDDKLYLRGRWWGPLKKGVRLRRYDPADSDAFHLNGTPIIFKRDAAGRVERLCMRLYAFDKKR